MAVTDIVTIIIAAYAAILSTILGVYEFRKEKRSIKIYLEHVYFYETVQLTIFNMGHRAITINEISMLVEVGTQGKVKRPYFDPVPANSMFNTDRSTELPFELEDGKQKTIRLSQTVSDMLLNNRLSARITVFDAEGNQYKNYEKRGYNPKWGYYQKIHLSKWHGHLATIRYWFIDRFSRK